MTNRLIPWQGRFRRKTLKYWGSAAIKQIRDIYIDSLKRCIDDAESDATDHSLQYLGDRLCEFGDYVPEALKIFWEPRNKFEQECLQLRKEYIQQLVRVSNLLGRISGPTRDIVLVFFAQHCGTLNLYWTAPPQQFFNTWLPPLDGWQRDRGQRVVFQT
jgi:hypothetical protein